MSDSYKLVWSDDFDSPEIDSSSWNVECHDAAWINSELQEYTDSKRVVFVKNSCLIIRPEKTINSDGSISYYSGYVTSSKLKSFKYGRFEAKIKIPRGRGILPAFKLISDSDKYGEWPNTGDIGIMEILGQEPSKIYTTIRFGNPLSQRQGCDHIYEGAYSDDFHVYACEWNPDEISFFVDGKKIYSTNYWFTNDDDGNEIAPYPAPFDQPFALCLQMSIGSQWAGLPDAKTEYGDAAQMYVDYVRVYQKDEYDENVVRPEKILKMREPDDKGNYLLNGVENWEFQLHRSGAGRMTHNEEEIMIETDDMGDVVFSIQLVQPGVPLIKGESYKLSFDACSDQPRRMSACVTAPDVGWAMYLKYTPVYLEKDYQHHEIFFDMTYDSDDNARVEFNAGNQDDIYRIRIKNIKLEKVTSHDELRKVIAVCGVWEDAENFSHFLESLQKPILTKDNVIAGVTFGSVVMNRGDENIQNRLIEYVDEMDLSAIIIFAEMLKSENIINGLVRVAQRRKIPIFCFEHDVEGCINSSYEYKTGFRTIVDHLIEVHDCKKIYMMTGFIGNHFSEERIQVYKESMKAHNLEVDEEMIFFGDFWNAKAEIVLQEALDRGIEIPDAIVCANDSMAVGVCDCLKKNGIKVPEQVKVTGFDGIREAKSHNPIISTCEPDYNGIVNMIADTIQNWNEERVGVTENRITKYIPKFNSSCGCDSGRNEEWYNVVSKLASDNQDYFRHVLEMGQFVSYSINMDDIDLAAEELKRYVWLWSDYYYFIGLNRDEGCTHGIFCGEAGKFLYRQKFYNYPTTIPNLKTVLKKGGKYNTILIKQLRSMDESYGIMAQAYNHLSLRDEQRFEEFSLYVSAVVSSVINKQSLIIAKDKIEVLSESDYLTGLYNRRGFLRQVQEILDNPIYSGKVISMFSIDMDGLKMINDNYGHNEGDCAIKVLARSLRAYAGNRGICARYGGDEFAICIVGDHELLPEFVNIHDRIRNHCLSDSEMEDKPYNVDASIGISERRIRPGVNLEDLISFSDTAMYIDKQSRKMSK